MADSASHEEELLFEAEVLRVARALYAKSQPYQGSTYIDNAERDGLFIGDDVVVVVEATVSLRLDKAKKDGDKLASACERLVKQHPYKAIKGFFVTRNEPTADQRRYIASLKPNIVACSIEQFRALLVDSHDYLRLRQAYAFGSARNPRSGSAIELDNYLPIGLLDTSTAKGGPKSYNVEQIAQRTSAGESTIVMGDFGAGKSMTIREVHRNLAAIHHKGLSPAFPMTLNLRDHQGQKEPDEAIQRHASRLGFESPAKLVRAWRAGTVHVLLDGFDEIATTGWIGQAANLQDIRRRSVELVRKFVEQTPDGAGVVLAGRRHLFDTTHEMYSALGLASRKALNLATDQFSEEQVSEYLSSHGWSGSLPTWLPSRPLLLGYLVTAGAIEPFAADGENLGPAEGWDMLLDRICEREATMEVGIDGATVRQVLERLATLARCRQDGTGPILKEDLSFAFQQTCGYAPDEGSYLLLQRMPGLGGLDLTDGSRHFIDGDLADAARAGDVVRYIQNSGADDSLEAIQNASVPLGELGLGVAEILAERAAIAGSQASAMAKRLQGKGASSAFVLDAARISLSLGGTEHWPTLSFNGLLLERVIFGDVEHDLSSMTFADCVIESLDLTEYDGDHSLPIFERCALGTVLGAGSLASLPDGHFLDCTFEQFDPSSKTTRGILAAAGLSGRQRVMLTVLKKIYMQAGAGRKHSALIRGLSGELKVLIPDVIDRLVTAQLIVKGRAGKNVLYYPVRGSAARARRLLEGGVASGDQVLVEAR